MEKIEWLQNILNEITEESLNENNIQIIKLLNEYINKMLCYTFVDDYVVSNSYFSSFRTDIKLRIEENISEKEALYKKFEIDKENGIPRSNEDNIKSIILRIVYDKLKTIKTNFDEIYRASGIPMLRRKKEEYSFINNLENDANNAYNALEEECLKVIRQTQAYKFINNPMYGNSQEALEFIYQYYHDIKLRKDVKVYNLNLEKGFHVYEVALQEASKYYEYLTLMNSNQEMLRKYIKLRTATSTDKKIALESDKISSEKKLSEISRAGISGLVHKGKINKINDDIQKTESALKKIKFDEPTLIELEKILTSNGLGNVLKEYFRQDLNGNGTPEERAAYFIKKHLTPTTFEGITEEINKAYAEKELCKERENTAKNEAISNIPSIHKLVGINYNELRSVEHLSTEKVNGIDPRIAIYILMFIRAVKGLKYFNFSEIIDLSDSKKNELVALSDKLILGIKKKYHDEIVELIEIDFMNENNRPRV